MVQYLDFDRLEAIDPKGFQKTEPYPWVNPAGLLTDEGYRALVATLPDVSQFRPVFGKERKFGQRSHDRFALDSTDDPKLEPPWQEFLAEVRSERYERALARLAGRRHVDLDFHWHYTPAGCSVSPHCDSKTKLGSHIFYFNTEQEWERGWGGATLVLGSNRKLDRKSAPEFSDFEQVIESECIGNRSFLFVRREDSWHGVREITCPEGHFRKVFIVTINKVPVVESVKRSVGMSA